MADAPATPEFDALLSQVAQLLTSGRSNGAGQIVTDTNPAQPASDRRGRWDRKALERLGTDAAPVSTDVSPDAIRLAEGIGSFAAEPTGVPSMVRGGQRIYNADGDPYQVALGAGEIGLGLVPGASAARSVASPIVNALLAKAIPGLVAGGAGLAGEAYAQDQIKADKAAGNENAGGGFWNQIGDLFNGGSKPKEVVDQDTFVRDKLGPYPSKDAILKDVRQETMPDDPKRLRFGPGSAEKEAQRRYDAAKQSYDDQLAAVRAQYPAYKQSVEELNNRGFKEKYPDVAARLPMLGLAASAAVPATLGGVKNAISWLPSSTATRLQTATRAADNALLATPEPNLLAAGLQGNKLDAAIDAAQSPWAKLSKVGGPVLGIGGGAGIGAEFNMLPYQIDANALPEGSPKQVEAQKNAYALTKWGSKALMNVPTAITGYKFSGIIPEKTPDLAGAIGTRDTVAQLVNGQPVGPQPLPPANALLGGNAANPKLPAPANQLPAIPAQSQNLRTYRDLPQGVKDENYQYYQDQRRLIGGAPPQQSTADAIKSYLASQGVNVPLTPERIKESEQGILWFLKTFKREPNSPADFQAIRRQFNGRTLALPGMIIGGNALLAPSDDQPSY